MKKYLVLIVDDDPGIRGLLEVILGLIPGVLTIVAADGRDGLAKATNRTPDLVILDMMLPAMLGTEVALRLKAQLSTVQIPIIGLSSGHDMKAAALRSGCDQFLDKPFDVDCITAMVQQYRAHQGPERMTAAK